MKTFLIILFIIVGLFTLFQLYLSMSLNKTETQSYQIIRTEKDYEIRFYPSVTMAMIISSAKSYKELGSSGFRHLANYIFGGNDAKKQISMTSPVHMDINDSAASMGFVMPSVYNMENLPKPNDSSVIIKQTSDEYVAAIKFEGFASDKDIKFYSEKLENALNAASIPFYGSFRFLGYNPPYQLFGRKNEIIVSINWGSK